MGLVGQTLMKLFNYTLAALGVAAISYSEESLRLFGTGLLLLVMLKAILEWSNDD